MTIYKPKAISGFPEWLPEYRAVELAWMDQIRAVFESYGFCSVETPSVEEIDVLLAKAGETEKEIYTLTRLQAEGEEDARLALHFDLTVPIARYVAQHFDALAFPFKRYQIQRSWRGERPQKGRYREFIQCDVDVVNVDGLPLHFDAEMPAVLLEAYRALDIPPVSMHISNRKILTGALSALQVENAGEVTRTLDKLDKIGVQGVRTALTALGMNESATETLLKLAQIQAVDDSFVAQVSDLGLKGELLQQGVDELAFVMRGLSHVPKGGAIANLGIIRGFDYYTGTVFEVKFQDHAISTISIGGGGRYDDLAGSFINRHLPGIGGTLGITRLFGLLMDRGLIKAGARSPAHILVVLPDEARRDEAMATAAALRAKGYNVEMYHSDTKLKKQLAYAEKKNIPFVWFPPFKEGQPSELKNMTTGQQRVLSLEEVPVWQKNAMIPLS